MLLSMIDDTSSGRDQGFQQTIFGQDKPILENQVPKTCRSIREPRPRFAPTPPPSPTGRG